MGEIIAYSGIALIVIGQILYIIAFKKYKHLLPELNDHALAKARVRKYRLPGIILRIGGALITLAGVMIAYW